ncbi:hypothetical protein H0H92_010827, partial [Tricholoma furcatifolium]
RRRRKPRPPAGALSFNEAVRIFGRKHIFSPLDSDENTPIIDDFFDIRLGSNKSCTIYHGLLLVSTFDFEPTSPTEGELEFFYSFSAFSWLQQDPDCQDALVNLAASRLRAGDAVEVVEKSEPLWNARGVITAVERDVATVQIDTSELQDGVAIPLVALRALYQVGNYVKVVHGRHWRKTGFIVEIADALLTINDHRSTSDPQFVVPAHSVQWHVDPKITSTARAPAVVPLPKTKIHDPYVGRQVRIISSEQFKGYEARIVKRMDNDDTKVQVEVVAQLAHAKAQHTIVPLYHLADFNDPLCAPLMQVFNSATHTPFPNQKIIRQHPPPEAADFPLSRHPLLPATHDPRQEPPRAAATPAWTAGQGSSSTPAWDPSSRTPHSGTPAGAVPSPASF